MRLCSNFSSVAKSCGDCPATNNRRGLLRSSQATIPVFDTLCNRSHSTYGMSFRKRNIGLSPGLDRTSTTNAPSPTLPVPSPPELSGTRPSPDDGRATTSTGCRSLDNLLAGHAGLPMGKVLLIEENGTTDFAGALLRYYAAEGVVQDHKLHVVGVPEPWRRSLPGLIGSADAVDEQPDKRKDEKMKIAWRYERLGEFGAGIAGSRGECVACGEARDHAHDI